MDENYAYDRETLACMAGFNALWQRVTQNTPQSICPPTLSEDEQLHELICREFCAVKGYTALTRMFSTRSRTLLIAHGNDAKRRARRLHGEYFIRTGLRCRCEKDCPFPDGKLPSLRSLLRYEQDLSDDYRAAAERTRCPILKDLYGRFSDETAERAKALRALLLDCF